MQRVMLLRCTGLVQGTSTELRVNELYKLTNGQTKELHVSTICESFFTQIFLIFSDLRGWMEQQVRLAIHENMINS